MPHPSIGLLSSLAQSYNDRPTTDSVHPTGSPIDLLVGGMAGEGESVAADVAGGKTISQNIAEGAASSEASIQSALKARDPNMLARWNNRAKFPLSEEESDYVDHLESAHNAPQQEGFFSKALKLFGGGE